MASSDSLQRLLNVWRKESTIAESIVHWRIEAERPALWEDFPPDLAPEIADALIAQHIIRLYSHQAESWRSIRAGKDVILTTGTASGKTLCYHLPVIQTLLQEPKSRALFLFPTRALTQDQLKQLGVMLSEVNVRSDQKLTAAIYDGDTPTAQRPSIRQNSRILLSNPDMLHLGILPHHTNWMEFFRGLRFIVIDEMHTYRGVFGSHLANVLRRLKRVAAHYGSYPQFIMTSATIANPQQLGEKLAEKTFEVIETDGSPRGERNFLLINPPIVNEELGLRRGALAESTRLAGDLLAYRIQTIIFTRSRRMVELALKELRFANPADAGFIHGYRSGYLPEERRQIEQSIRNGKTRTVVATNALELGIDIGGLEAVLLAGYPGTIAATRQQSGRAGRRQGNALAVMVASANPIDQFLMRHPDYLFGRSPENALVDPDHLLILLQHLRCAAFELPFKATESFGNADPDLVQGLLAALEQNGELHQGGTKYYWTANQYPATQVSLRSTADQPIKLQTILDEQVISVGEIDPASAYWMVHPQAIYLHEGASYLVEELDLEKHIARLTPHESDYYTEPQQTVSIENLNILEESVQPGGIMRYGDLLVTSQVTGYRQFRWGSREILGKFQLDLPATQLRTTGLWLALDDAIRDSLRTFNMWNSSPNIYGKNWDRLREITRYRDRFTCQNCGMVEQGSAHHVHHKIPFRTFTSIDQANALDNLITLCPNCHQRAEQVVKVRTGLSGLGYCLTQIAPLLVMCDLYDLGSQTDPQSPLSDGQPTIVIYDQIPAGIGLSKAVFDRYQQLIRAAYELVTACPCREGCPACVGPAGENGVGGKAETLALLSYLNGVEYLHA